MGRGARGIVGAAVALAVVLGLVLTLGREPAREATPPGRTATTPARRSAGADEPSGAADVPRWLLARGVPPLRIAGRVSADGAPFAGARVRLDLSGSGPPLMVAETTSDRDGRFDFGTRPAAWYVVTAVAPAKTAAVVHLNPVRPKAPSDALQLSLVGCAARAAGVVRDASGGIIEGARVAYADAPWVLAMTTSAGTYELCVPREPHFRLVAGADGYGSISIRADDPSATREIVLVPEGTVRGRVVRKADGAAVAHARVAASAEDDSMTSASADGDAVTDETGRFHIGALVPGRYGLAVAAEGLCQPELHSVLVLATRESDEVVVRLVATSRVSGKVQRDGAPLAGVRLIAERRGPRYASAEATSREDGGFELTDVAPGEHTLSAKDHDVVSPRTLLVETREKSGVVVEVRGRGSIRGRVVRRGKPVPGAAITAYGGQHWRTWHDVVSAADGSFELTGAGAGSYSLRARDEASGAASHTARIEVAAGETREGVELELFVMAAVAGVVVDTDGRPVRDAFVYLQGRGGGESDATDEDGRFEARVLAGGGTYALSVHAGAAGAAYEAAEPFPRITLPEPDARIEGLRLVVRRGLLAISGKVVDASGAPAADVSVGATWIPQGRPEPARGSAPAATAITAVDGRFRLAGLREGAHALVGRAADGAEGHLSAAAGASDVVLTLQPPGRIVGKLVGFTSAPVVEASGPDGRRAVATVDGEGFEVPGLLPGRYTVSAAAGRELAAVETEVVAGGAAQVTLRRSPRARVRGQVVELGSGAPVAGLDCRAAPRLAPQLEGAEASASDASGRFEIADAPAGDITVSCTSESATHSSTSALLSVAEGAIAEVELMTVAAPPPPRGFIGVQLAEREQGVVVASVLAGTPAARGGLLDGDEVVAVDGLEVARVGAAGIIFLVGSHAPGTTFEITVRRGGATQRLRVSPVARPSD